MKNLKSLSDLQKNLSQIIMDSEASATSLLKLNQEFLERPPLSIPDRVNVYQQAYRIRLTESLREDFPRLIDEIGEDKFEALALSFLQTGPSQYANLAEVSQHFPDFVKNIYPEQFLMAVHDWLECLALSSQEVDSQQKLSGEEIQNGVEFILAKTPAVHWVSAGDKIHQVYINHGTVSFDVVTENETKLLQSMSLGQNIHEISNLATLLGFSEAQIQSLFADWISKDIIYCERI